MREALDDADATSQPTKSPKYSSDPLLRALRKRTQQKSDDADTPPPAKSPKRSSDAKPTAVGHADKDKLKSSDEFELVRAEFERIEATEPWRYVFHAKLTLPLKHPKLTLALQRFLIVHGRAIWERKFWLSLSNPGDEELCTERRKRQESAKNIYIRRVITPAYKLIGAKFFVELDALESPHEGWWYRQPVVNLRILYQVKGVDFCIKYLRDQCHERFPDPHMNRSKNGARGHHTLSKSMWSSDAMVELILRSIKAIKSGEGDTVDNKNAKNKGDGDDDDRTASDDGRSGKTRKEAGARDNGCQGSDDNDPRRGESDADL